MEENNAYSPKTECTRCPKCGKVVESLVCGHCGSSLPDWQADLYGAAIRQIAKLGGNRADAGQQGGDGGDHIDDHEGLTSELPTAEAVDLVGNEETVDQESAASNGKATRSASLPVLTDEERHRREIRTSLIHGDAVEKLKTFADAIADVFLFDPIYPHIEREYGTITEDEWHDLMKSVLQECRRILKPHGSVVVIILPNKEKVGRMRLWTWDFVTWAARMWPDWGLVQDQYAHFANAIPCAGANRKDGLMRQSVKWGVWLGKADCYRNQDAVLEEPTQETLNNYRTDHRPERRLGGHRIRRDSFRSTLEDRGGVTPHNMLIARTGASNHGHPAVTPYPLAEWWCKYLLPPDGVLIDCFCGSGTTLLAGLNCGASKVIGIDKEEGYLEIARRRICHEKVDTTVKSSTSPSNTESSGGQRKRRMQVWPSAPDPLSLHEVEQWKGGKLTVLEEAIRRFFTDKPWCVGGPIPLRLLYSADSMSLVLNAGQYGGLRRSGDLLGQDALGQLTDQMKARGISKKHHGGLALLYLRLCKGLEVTSEQSRLAS